MKIQFDGNGRPYMLIGQEGGTQFRITAYPAPGLWSKEPEIRIVRQIGTKPDASGPSIPISMLGDFMKAITELIPELAKAE
jgi:hypothetical protein